jgi:beta-lactamase superfamily II metal-dependent hydrolase
VPYLRAAGVKRLDGLVVSQKDDTRMTTPAHHRQQL